MAKLKNIWLEKQELGDSLNFYNIRLDWDNDRHQALKIENLNPISVYNSLIDAANLIRQEIENEEI